MSALRLVWRLLFFLCYTARIVAEIWWRQTFHNADLRTAMRVRRRWARRLLRVMGIRGQATGTPPDFACILVANHRSYLDPILLLRDVDGFPVAKAEVEGWPLLGKGAQRAGILYVEREHGGSRAATLRLMAEKIAQGFPVIIFPEGTTSDINGTLPFKKGAFNLAAKEGIPIVPVALHFYDPRDFWIGNDTFFGHITRRFGEQAIRVEVEYGPTLRDDDAERLLQATKNWIDAALHQRASPEIFSSTAAT